MTDNDHIGAIRKINIKQSIKKKNNRNIIENLYTLRKVNSIIYNKQYYHNIKDFNINNVLYKKIEQTLLTKYKDEMLELGLSEFVFKEPDIEIKDIKIETTIDSKRVLNISAIADIDEVVTIEGKRYYYNMLLPFSITKIAIDNSTVCPSFE